MKVYKGDFIGITGTVGSGKSSLLMGILGELDNFTGKICTSGKIFYCSQEPWLFTASIKQNIIFGNMFVKEKFDKVVEACSLKKVIFLTT